MSAPTREAGLLQTGDRILSPAYRWETVTETVFIDRPGSMVKVWTDATGNGYAWHFTPYRRLVFIPLPEEPVRSVKLFEADDAMFVALAQPDDLVWRSDSVILVSAKRHENGWTVEHRPDGGAPSIEHFTRRGSARHAVRRHARVHAEALGLRVSGDVIHHAPMGSSLP